MRLVKLGGVVPSRAEQTASELLIKSLFAMLPYRMTVLLASVIAPTAHQHTSNRIEQQVFGSFVRVQTLSLGRGLEHMHRWYGMVH